MSTLRIIRVSNPEDLQGFIEEIRYLTRQKEVAGAPRASYRFRFRLPMTITFDFGTQQKTINASMENISPEGVSFLSHWQFDPGQPVSVTVESKEIHYRAESKIIYSIPYVDSYKTGVQFTLSRQTAP